MAELSGKQRRHLRALGHHLSPVLQIGQEGLTDSLVAQANAQLDTHELIKVKIGTDDRASRVAIGNDLCTRAGATAVHRVGKVIILWRPRPAE